MSKLKSDGCVKCPEDMLHDGPCETAVERDARRYRALRDQSTKDLGVRRKSGWTYIAVTGPQLDRAADVLARVQENEDGRQHPSVPTEEA